MAAAAAARAGAAKAKANEALNPSADKKKTDAQIMEEELEKKRNESRDFYLDEEQWNTAPAKKYIKFAQACGQFTRPEGMYESYFSNFIIGCVHREDSSVTRHDAERGPPSTFRVHCVGCGALAIPTHRSARACATSARDVRWCCVRERERRLPACRPGRARPASTRKSPASAATRTHNPRMRLRASAEGALAIHPRTRAAWVRTGSA